MIPLPAHGRDTAGDHSERAIELSKLEGGRPSFGVGRRVRDRTQRSGASRMHAVLLVCLDFGSDGIRLAARPSAGLRTAAHAIYF